MLRSPRLQTGPGSRCWLPQNSTSGLFCPGSSLPRLLPPHPEGTQEAGGCTRPCSGLTASGAGDRGDQEEAHLPQDDSEPPRQAASCQPRTWLSGEA